MILRVLIMFSLHTTDAIARVENKSLTRVIDISYCHYLKNKSDRALVLYNAWLWHLTNTQAQRLWWMPRCWCHAVCAHSLIDLMWHTFGILISRLYFLMLGSHHRCVFQSQAMYLRLQRRQPIAACVFEVSVPYFVLFLQTLSIFLFNKCKCKFKHSPPPQSMKWIMHYTCNKTTEVETTAAGYIAKREHQTG